MSDPKLQVAFGEYARTRVLADGTVKIKGVDSLGYGVVGVSVNLAISAAVSAVNAKLGLREMPPL